MASGPMGLRAGKALRGAVVTLLWLTGIPALVRRVTRGRVGILLYHDPPPDVFDRHLAYLRSRYHLIPFSQLVDGLQRRDFSTIPPHSLVLHIDDGYAGNHRLMEVLERHGVQPTLYLCSHVAGTDRHFWSRLKDGRSKRLRRVNNARLLHKLRQEAGFTPEREYPTRCALSGDEIRAMSKCVDFQSHGRFHFSLPTLDPESLALDLRESRERVEELSGRPCRHFSFPYGDYGLREIEAVERAQYVTARTTDPGWVGVDTNPLVLPIVADVPADATLAELRVQLSGVPRLVKRTAYRLITRHLHAARERVLMKRRYFRP